MVAAYIVEHHLITLGVDDHVALQVGHEALRHDASNELGILASLDFGSSACGVPYTDLVVHSILSVLCTACREYQVAEAADTAIRL